MRDAFGAFVRGDLSELVRWCNRNDFAAATLRLRQTGDGTVHVALVPGSLLQAMWVQLVLYASSGARLLRCERCSAPFVVGTNTGRRNTRKFCGNACKVAASKQKKRRLASGGMTHAAPTREREGT
jgi:hypothetical protein